MGFREVFSSDWLQVEACEEEKDGNKGEDGPAHGETLCAIGIWDNGARGKPGRSLAAGCAAGSVTG